MTTISKMLQAEHDTPDSLVSRTLPAENGNIPISKTLKEDADNKYLERCE